MAAAHNMFITGLNAIVHHGPTVSGNKVKPFMVFCLTVVRRASYFFILPTPNFLLRVFQLENIHHHHTLEEDFYFPAMEEKLGKGALSVNVEQHKEFVPGVGALEEWCKKVQNDEVEYDGKVLLGLIEAFGDTMIAHLNSVSFHFAYSTYPLINPIGNSNVGPRDHSSAFYNSRTQSHRQ